MTVYSRLNKVWCAELCYKILCCQTIPIPWLRKLPQQLPLSRFQRNIVKWAQHSSRTCAPNCSNIQTLQHNRFQYFTMQKSLSYRLCCSIPLRCTRTHTPVCLSHSSGQHVALASHGCAWSTIWFINHSEHRSPQVNQSPLTYSFRNALVHTRSPTTGESPPTCSQSSANQAELPLLQVQQQLQRSHTKCCTS